MSLPVFWTDEANETFESVVAFIEGKWGFASAQKFVRKANRTITTITHQPYIFKAFSDLPNLRQTVITKQTSLFYQVHEQYIALVFFWDNRQEPMME